MATFNNSSPTDVNNVGQFGATEGTIGAYKQASEYAADAKYWALLAESKFGSIDELMEEVERLFHQGELLAADIEQLKQDFEDQDARLMQLIAETNAAVSDANNAIAVMEQLIAEIQARLDILLGMTVEVVTLPPGSDATGSFDPDTGVISLGIPEGDKGADGSVTDLSSVDFGTPEIDDIGFYVDKDDSTVHKATLSDIANLIPSVRSISVNGGPAEDGDVTLTIDKTTVGLDNVENVASYSKEAINGFVKVYTTKSDADADAALRAVDEDVLVWNGASYDFYTVQSDHTLALSKSEPRIITVNSRVPDSNGNINITIPTGNPSLYLGEMLMFPYDPDRNIAYQGILPADGRTTEATPESDLGASLISGQLPVVSETEWQAGARQYFSWGKLADGVTDADSTNFIQIRLPDWTGGEAIRSPSSADSAYDGSPQAQKVYVATVNNKAPADATGNVSITASDVSALPLSGGTITGAVYLTHSASLFGRTATGDPVPLLSVNGEDDVSIGSTDYQTVINSAGRIIHQSEVGAYDVYTTGNKPALADLGAAASGINSDITSLTNLGGPLRLGGDGVNDFDAVTVRQLNNSGGGGSGANLNGIMNFGVGSFRLQDSRAFIANYEVYSDGQLLNRADWPELWTYAQTQTPIDDADWLSTPSERGKYSNGDGSTTFRVPDRNGAQSGSITALFGRGDGGGSFGVGGAVQSSAAPNITGSALPVNGSSSNDTRTGVAGHIGAFYPLNATSSLGTYASAGSVTGPVGIGFDASRSSGIYGRTSAEIRPNSFIGVWVIRASGGFTAANTSWSVINADETTPPSNVYSNGGIIQSDYYIAGSRVGTFSVKSLTNDGVVSGVLGVSRVSNGDYTEYYLRNNKIGGNVVAHAAGQANNWNDTKWLGQQSTQFFTAEQGGPGGAGSVAFGFSTSHSLANDGQYGLQVCGRQSTLWYRTWEAGVFQGWQKCTATAVSDERIKKNIEDTDGIQSLENIKAMELKTFVFKNDEKERVRRGVIAQQIQKIDPEYVSSIFNQDENGNDVETLALDTNALLLDSLAAIKVLSQKVEKLESRLAELESK